MKNVMSSVRGTGSPALIPVPRQRDNHSRSRPAFQREKDDPGAGAVFVSSIQTPIDRAVKSRCKSGFFSCYLQALTGGDRDEV
jgi:hypothetical protein